MSENETQIRDAMGRLLALPAWYENFCAGPHPYADARRPKQDSGELMARVSADIRAVCGRLKEFIGESDMTKGSCDRYGMSLEEEVT